jgi:hypothetical protein
MSRAHRDEARAMLAEIHCWLLFGRVTGHFSIAGSAASPAISQSPDEIGLLESVIHPGLRHRRPQGR